MIISHLHKFAILSPWKTASSTLGLRFGFYDQSLYPRFFYFNRHLCRVVHHHLIISDFIQLPEGKLDYKTASFVRNPYDRAYSGFLQLQRDIEQQPTASYQSEWIKALVFAQLAENKQRLSMADYNFDKWISLLPDYEVYESGRNTNMPLHPAHYWTHIDGRKVVDFVGKVEDFENDIIKLCNFLGIPLPKKKNGNVSTVVRNLGPSGYRYISCMSRSTIDRINCLFAEDFSTFGFCQI